MTATAKIIPPHPTPRRVVLEMDERDAIALQSVIGWRVSGKLDGPRSATERIYKALGDAGIDSRADLCGSGTTMADEWPEDLRRAEP